MEINLGRFSPGEAIEYQAVRQSSLETPPEIVWLPAKFIEYWNGRPVIEFTAGPDAGKRFVCHERVPLRKLERAEASNPQCG